MKSECLKSFYQPVLLLYELEEDSSKDRNDEKNDDNYNDNNNNNNNKNNNDHNDYNNIDRNSNNSYDNNNRKRQDIDNNHCNDNDLIHFDQIKYDREELEEKTSSRKKLINNIEMIELIDIESKSNGNELQPSVPSFHSSSSSFPSSFTYPTIPLVNDFNTYFGITNSISKDSTDFISICPSTNDLISEKNILEGKEFSSKTNFSPENDIKSEFSNSSHSGQLLSIVIYESKPIITTVTLPLHDESTSVIVSDKNTSPEGCRRSDLSNSLRSSKSTTSTLPKHQHQHQHQHEHPLSLQSQIDLLSQEQVHHDSIKKSSAVPRKQKKVLGILHDVNEKGHIIITNFVRHPVTGIVIIIFAH